MLVCCPAVLQLSCLPSLHVPLEPLLAKPLDGHMEAYAGEPTCVSAWHAAGTCLPGLHVAPEPLLAQRVALHGHVAGLRQGQLQHQRARVVRDAAHHVQAAGRARHDHVVLSKQAANPLHTPQQQPRQRLAKPRVTPDTLLQ